ncbi:tripartite tricarboxylate transporter substrate binding protein [Marispirochaeta aestuarii]|uniref:Bug family tripartite tricarboxylate transporter substrate binding protein n=1 Tax=Marispirochaeta aestuarii TaxID=1963862 RepID=UPI0029C661CB|nr:tripartite tricarboxylate transporter substrate binding protein [Marispirochaeta aestuarii]
MRKLLFFGLLFFLVCGLSLSFAEGQQDISQYPSKDIKVIINAGAGGGTDTIMRKIISIAEKNLDVAVYPVNKPGAASASGPFEVMKSPANGYTLGNLNYGSVINAVWEELIAGYDLEKLEIFCMITQEADAIMVPADSPYKTFDDFIAAAKANPGKIKVGDQGVGSRVYMHLIRLEEEFGVEFNKVQYVEGSGPQREAILNGEIDAAITSLGDFTSLLTSGKARGLVEFSDSQNLTYTDVPPVTELGYSKDLMSGSFIMLGVPADTPKPIVDKLESIFYEAHQSREFRDWLATIGVTATWMPNGEVDEFLANVQKKEFTLLDRLKAEGALD